MNKQKKKEEMTCYDACVEDHDRMLAEALNFSSTGGYKESALARAIKGLPV